jgi:hypothetical protein
MARGNGAAAVKRILATKTSTLKGPAEKFKRGGR